MVALAMPVQEHQASALRSETESLPAQLLALDPRCRTSLFLLLNLRGDSHDRQCFVVACDKSMQSTSQYGGHQSGRCGCQNAPHRDTSDRRHSCEALRGELSMQPKAGRRRFVNADHLTGLGLLFGHPFQEPLGGHLLGRLLFGPSTIRTAMRSPA